MILYPNFKQLIFLNYRLPIWRAISECSQQQSPDNSECKERPRSAKVCRGPSRGYTRGNIVMLNCSIMCYNHIDALQKIFVKSGTNRSKTTYFLQF